MEELKGKALFKNYTPLNIPEEDWQKLKENVSSKSSLQKSKENEIKSLKSQLSSTDYQVIKCYEYSLAGLELPYDITLLHEEREAIREQIRALEDSEI